LSAVLLLAAGLAALLGLAQRALPDRTSLDLLTRLGPLGYPTSGRVLRYVEDNPAGLERAIGTAVDPNSFGGMLALAAAVALGELLARWNGFRGRKRPRPSALPSPDPPGHVLPLTLLLLILGALLLCLYLTYSRAALGGFAVAALFLAAVRYRRLWWGVLAAAVLIALAAVALGPDHPVVARFSQGLAFQDLANQMRLDEYANAWAIVRRYPVLGVGYGAAPDADLTLGVSSLYLTIAERMGLVGLAAFVAAIGAAFGSALGLARHEGDGEAGRRIALLAGVVAALAIGLLDHYYFNPDFPHMVLLFWGALGAASVSPAAR
jgi:O-antigen ligase